MTSFILRNPYSRLCALLIASSGALLAQSSAVGHISGKVIRPDGTPFTRQLVVVETPRGNREIRTNEKGEFFIPNLVPGKVTVKVSAPDMLQFRSEILVLVNQTSNLSIRLRPQASTTVEVVDASSSLPLNTTDQTQAKTGLTTNMEVIDNLPIPLTTSGDRVSSFLTLVPGTNTGLAYHGGSTVSYHVDGVDTTDSVYGSSITKLNNDLVDQVQMLTGGVSAKYGRFDGGLVSVTTKSGTNAFEGSARFAVSNPKWGGIGKTPEIYTALNMPIAMPLDATTTIQSYTFMGPIIKDTLFFSLGYQTYSPEQKTAQTTGGLIFAGVPYVSTTSETRQDAKLDWLVNNDNRIYFQYNHSVEDSNNQYTNVGNPSSLATLSGLTRTTRGYFSLGWTSQLAPNLLLDVKYNDTTYKNDQRGSSGGNSVVSWLDVPDYTLFDNGTFAGVVDERHQKVFSAGVTWFAKGLGEHQVEAGVQGYQFTDQTGALDYPSGYLIQFNGFIPGAATPALGNRLLEPGNPALTQLISQQAVSGKATSRNQSVYLNDTWSLDKHVSLNLGLRYDNFSGTTVPENNTYSTHAFAPRLAVNYDLAGDKTRVFSFTAAEYQAQILQGSLANASVTKTPITRTYAYNGPAAPAGQGNGQQALNANGSINWSVWGNLAGANGVNNYMTSVDPIQNRTTFVDPNLKAPRTRELTLGYHQETSNQAFAANLVRRWMDRFLDAIWTGDGIAPGVAGILISNDPEGKRDYYGLELTYRNNAYEHVSFGGNATWSRSLDNVSGQSQANNFGMGGQQGIPRDQLSPYGPSRAIDRPFVFHGDVTFKQELGKGTFNVSLLGSFFGKETYGYRFGTALTDPNLVAQGYAATYNRFFPELGPLHQPEYYTLDMQIGYTHAFTKKMNAFLKINIQNILNYMPNYMNTYYGTAYTGTYQPYALVDGLGTLNIAPRTASFDLGFRF